MTSEERKSARFQRRTLKRQENKKRLQQFDSFENVINPDNLVKAFTNAKKGVSWKTSTQRYEMNRLKNISKTITDLENNKNTHRGFVEFDIYERGKTRHIQSIHIEERVIQKCLCDEVLVPLLSNGLIYDNGASLKKKGLQFSLKRLTFHLSSFYRSQKFSNNGYVLTIDFSKFFDRIVHHILIKEQNRHIRDLKIQQLIWQFIHVFGDDISLGLGSQISQISSVFYPNKIDHFIKEILQIKYYGRYMDDMYLIHHDKLYLQQCLLKINELCTTMGIVINQKKTCISKLSTGFKYLKGRFILTDTGKVIQLPSKESIKRFKRKLLKFKKLLFIGKITMADIQNTYKSWRGNFMRRFDAYYILKHLDEYYNSLFNTY
jgi:hypothetical protein